MALFVTFYEEKWVFNISEKTVEKRFGLIFYYSRETADLSDIMFIKISEVRKGNKNKGSSKYLKMTLVFKNETEKRCRTCIFQGKRKIYEKCWTYCRLLQDSPTKIIYFLSIFYYLK